MANISLGLLFAHWLAFLETLQQIFWNHIPRPLLSAVFPARIEDGPKFPGGSIDPTTTCPVATIFQPLLETNPVCGVNRSDYNASSAESTHYYMFLDTPVWGPPTPLKNKPPVSLSVQAEDEHVQITMAPYGGRKLSFCPVLVCIMYIQSLLHLYMLLMIPALFNHWLEDVLIYESLNTIELLDLPWYLHTSLWMSPCYVLRHGVRKIVSSLYRHFQRASCKTVRPSIPRIVLIRVDGEAVPINFVEDHQTSTDVGVWTPLESVVLNSRTVTSENGDLSDGEGSMVTELQTRPYTRTASYQGEHQGGIAEEKNGIEFGSLTSDFAEISQLVVNQIHNESVEIAPVCCVANELLQPVEQSVPALVTLVATPSDRSTDDRTTQFEQVIFPRVGVDDVCQGDADDLRERQDSDQEVILWAWSFVDDHGPRESNAPSEPMNATSSPAGLQDMPIPTKNVCFVTDGDACAAHRWQVSLSAPHTGERACTGNPEHQPGDAAVISEYVPALPFDPSVDEQDVTSEEQATNSVLPTVLIEESVEESDALAVSYSHSMTGEPIVNLPSLVAIREDVQFIGMDPVVPAELIEDVATRSPLQILSPIVPAVVINTNYIVETNVRSLRTPRNEQLDQGLPHAACRFDSTETLTNKRAACEEVDFVSPRGDEPKRQRSVEGSDSVCSPIADNKQPEDALSAAAAFIGASLSDVGTSPVDTNASPNPTIDVSGTNEVEILYETPRYYSNEKIIAGSLRNELPELEASTPDTTGAGERFHTVSISLEGPRLEDQDNLVADGKPDSTAAVLTVDHLPVASATGSPTTERSRRLLALLGARKEANTVPTTFVEKTGEMHHRKAETKPWDRPNTISKPPPERTLSRSMHAPPELLRIPQTNSRVGQQTSVLYETSPFVGRSTSLVRPGEAKGGTSVVMENTSERKQDLSASIHAPQRISKLDVQSSSSGMRDEGRHHRRSVTNPVVTPEIKTVSPNWTAIPEVVDAFRMFKQAASENSIRRISSVAECTNKGPTHKVVGQKGTATNSLNSTFATANIQSRWMHGGGLLLVRDLVTSDPSDFDLRTCTNLRTSVPALYSGIFDTSTCALQRGTAPCTVRINADFGLTVNRSTGVHRRQRRVSGEKHR